MQRNGFFASFLVNYIPMERLSVVIITYNEERNIKRCLESVKDIADEIVVLDSLSTDKTQEICSEFNVRFISQDFLGHIQQKNLAASYASNSWVLSLDADEALDQTLKFDIIRVLKNPQFNAYRMNRLTNYCGKWVKHSGWYPDTKARLWKKEAGEWGGENPHDKWELFDKKAPYGKLKGDILHYSYYSISEHIKQIEKFTEIAAKEAVKKGRTCSVPHVIFGFFWKFFHSYFIKLGILDGYTGFLICSLSAFSSMIKYAKIRQYSKQLAQ